MSLPASRNTTYAALAQVDSADLNALQDMIIAIGKLLSAQAQVVFPAVTLAGLLTANAGVTLAANQHVTVSGTGDFKHGDRVLIIPGSAANSNGSTTYNTTTGAINSTGAATIFFQIPLRVGDRIKSVTYSMQGDGAADVTSVDVRTFVAATSTAASIGTTSHTNPAAGFADFTIDVTDTTIAATMSTWIQFVINATGISLAQLRITYDRP